MMKKALFAHDPISGNTFRRETDRQYAYVVVADCADGHTGTLAWCGRHDLAVSKLNYYSKFIGVKDSPNQSPCYVWAAIRIIPVGVPL